MSKLYLYTVCGTRWWDRIIAELSVQQGYAQRRGKPVTHVGLLRVAADGSGVLIEAVPQRVHERALSRGEVDQLAQATQLIPIICTDEQIEMAWTAARAEIGALYNWVGIGLIGLYLLLHMPDLFYTSRRASVFCSELVVRCLRRARLPVLWQLAPDNCTPQRVTDWARRQKGLRAA